MNLTRTAVRKMLIVCLQQLITWPDEPKRRKHVRNQELTNSNEVRKVVLKISLTL